ncbi:hypothetical protein V495_04085 [Pseudogymnoascus sp. VKM F-4514 (FW-929)]|nr:hypothetical protein V495_04085 [Pseudogymnoascus sp. VKM F-4514 (FW-929)]KFY57841.1 hypothetical protein V497_05245 [Pseudogymnoascus sp. VKM F-4516 (FW-969)]
MLLSLTTKVAADSGYGASCNSIAYYNAADGSKEMFANCRENSGIYNVDTVINPDSCFANDNGQLHARLWGRYSGSCSDVGLSGTVLHANCKNAAGVYVATSIDTNNYIGNYDGRMKCFGQNGH